MVDHTVEVYDKELDPLERRIAEMGGIAEKMVADVMDALWQGDLALARQIVATDLRLDARQGEIEELAFLIIAQRQPMGGRPAREQWRDPRRRRPRTDRRPCQVYRQAVDEDRFNARVPRDIAGLKRMNEVVTTELMKVLDAYAQRDIECARAVWERDVELEALEGSLCRALLTNVMEDPRNISFCAHLLFCAKNIERVGDHATNVAETVVYLVTGSTLLGERPKGRRDHEPEVKWRQRR